MDSFVYQHALDPEEQGAVLSEDGQYRYLLWRRAIQNPFARGKVVFMMLNPSTADHRINDQTIRKCIGMARAWGFMRLEVVNLFAFRATKPANLSKASLELVDVVGPENDRVIRVAVKEADVICAWGALKPWMRKREAEVMEMLSEAKVRKYNLGLTKNADPLVGCTGNLELVP